MPTALHRAYQGKNVLVTGHTGFKGSWLCEWLCQLGSKVTGYALAPQPHETLFSQLGLEFRINDLRGDLAEREKLTGIIRDLQPDIIFHLAAQPLVRLSYDIPVETFSTNVMGTAHLLEAARLSGHPCRIVAVTTDKCYDNKEWLHAYREEDPMGGYDPYSASKGAAELVISSYRRSFFRPEGPIKLASARAGNVIGGGDWAIDRIVPDCIRAIRNGRFIPVRNKIATRPWQHVLEPLSGYLWLAAIMDDRSASRNEDIPAELLCSSFNFGPALTSNRTVAQLVQELIKHTGGDWKDVSSADALHEASKLNLATDKAFHLLEWQPVLSFEETIQMTAEWYLKDADAIDNHQLTISQIQQYHQSARAKKLRWAI